ncbi:glutaredoxin-like protein C5orf63 homolog isoform X2 [Saccoglossus kowalevskii]
MQILQNVTGAQIPRKLKRASKHQTIMLRIQLSHISKYFYSTAILDKLPILTLYTKKVCPLCDDAKEILKKYDSRFILQEVDITTKQNKDWYKLYRYDIPVFHFNGKFLMKHRVNEQLLDEMLQTYENAMKDP